MDSRKTGKKYEEQAALYLKKHGFVLLEQNFRCRQGEVDLVGLHKGCLVFVEVKYRRNNKSGLPEEAVDRMKQLKICMVSDYYRISHRKEADRQVRYDVVAICGDEVTWYQNAFPYSRKNGKGSW